MAMILDIENLTLTPQHDRLGQLWMSLIPALVARGWTVEGSGNGTGGTTFENSGQTGGPYNVFDGTWVNDGVTLWYAGAASSFSRSNAWLRMREPSPSTREIVFRRYTTSSDTGMCGASKWQVAPEGFTGADATLTSPPSAPGGTLGNIGSNLAWFSTIGTLTANPFKVNVLISDVAKAGNVWPFQIVIYDSVAGQAGGAIYDSLIGAAATDPHPLMWKATTSTLMQGVPNASTNTAWSTVQARDGVYKNALVVCNHSTGEQIIPGATQVVDAGGRRATFRPVIFTPDKCRKGQLEHVYWNPGVRQYPDTHAVASGSPYLYWGNLMLHWKTGVTPGS